MVVSYTHPPFDICQPPSANPQTPIWITYWTSPRICHFRRWVDTEATSLRLPSLQILNALWASNLNLTFELGLHFQQNRNKYNMKFCPNFPNVLQWQANCRKYIKVIFDILNWLFMYASKRMCLLDLTMFLFRLIKATRKYIIFVLFFEYC